MKETEKILFDLYNAWSGEDKDRFKLLFYDALHKGIKKEDMLRFFDKNDKNPPVDEDFEQWAYLYIVSDGMSDCPPG